MPIDNKILQSLSEYGFDLEYCGRCIEANKHNHITTTYYLLLKKLLRSGGVSNADIGSPNFDYSAIQPFRRVQPENKYHFFGGAAEISDKRPVIELDTNDICIGKKGEKGTFNIKPSTSKAKEKALYSSQNRRSNQLMSGSQERRQTDSNKQFYDLRMYLKAPRKKEYYSQTKRRKE